MHPRTVTAELPEDLVGIDVVRVRLPLLEPHVAAHGAEDAREVVLVRAVGGDGVDGWGECVALSRPGYTPEWTDGAWAELGEVLVPGALAGDPLAVGDHPMAWTALEVALLDLRLRRSGVALAAWLGAPAPAVPWCAVVGLHGSVAATVATARRRVDAGAAMVKAKVVPGAAAATAAAVREALDGVPVAVDANGSFDPDDRDHAAELARLDGLGLAYVEQPHRPERLDALVAASGRATPVAVDESVGGDDDLGALLAAGFAGVVNLKPGRVGGLDASRRILDRCAAEGLDAFVGGMLETGVGRATALAVAASTACTLPTDLGPSGRYFADDLTEPLEVLPDGRMPVPDGPGLGVVPRPERLVACVVAQRSVRR